MNRSRTIVVMLAVVAVLSVAAPKLQAGSFEGIGIIPNGSFSTVYAVSSDGTTVVGQSGQDACRWTARRRITPTVRSPWHVVRCVGEYRIWCIRGWWRCCRRLTSARRI